MPSVWSEKRKNRDGTITYWVRWRDKDGSKDQERFPNEAQMLDFKDKKKKELFAAPHGLPHDGTLTVRQAAKKFLESRAHDSAKSTQVNDETALGMFCHLFGDRILSSIDKEDLVNFKNWLFKDQHFSPNTVSMRLREVKTFFYDSLDMGKIQKMPFPRRRFIPAYTFTGRYLEDEELKVYLDELRAPPRPTTRSRHGAVWRACNFDIYTGLRRNEIVALDWANVFEAVVMVHGRPVRMRRMVIERRGRGYRRTTKTKKRMVYIPPEAWGFMGPVRKSGQVFAGLTESVINHQMARAVRRLEKRGVKIGAVRFHDMRHKWATNYMIENGDLAGLMQDGGWDTLQAVQVYQHLARGRSQSIFRLTYPGLADSAHSVPTRELEALPLQINEGPLSSSEKGPS